MLISDEYRKLNEQLHQAPRGFGGSGHRWYSEIVIIIDSFSVKSWLDYGCGQSTLWKEIKKRHFSKIKKIKYAEYDPAIKSKENIPPGRFDLVTCTDVLEHVEPIYLDNVIKHIILKANKIVFFNVNTKPSNKRLPDGRNAHLIVKNNDWWLDRIRHKTDWAIKERKSPRPWKDLNLWVYPK